MKWEIDILALICSFINVFSVRVRTIYHLRTHLLLQFTTALYSWISRAGNIIFGCGKKPFGTVLGLYLDSEKTRNNVNSRILPFFNFYQPAKHNRRYLFAARCTAHFNFIVEIAILLQLFSDNCKTSAVFMINAAKYFFTKLFSNFQQGINIQENVKLKVKQSTTNNVMTSCTDHKLQRLPWAANTQRNNLTICTC